MKVAIGCDHAGFTLKDVEVLRFLMDHDMEVIDHGTYSLDRLTILILLIL
ncbi:MAG: hypothetical protein IPM04_15330 [Saprospiraceae bacterium]|nr:RpiB/LacA/LacB family sugar-phosphate isomerase [Candidatus Brachybacter algidus]MBK8749133.1 hypothetical protein [Candidatus Brachybacter algidus]